MKITKILKYFERLSLNTTQFVKRFFFNLKKEGDISYQKHKSVQGAKKTGI